MLAVVTSSPRFYQQAVEELTKADVKFMSLGLLDKIPPEVDLVITSLKERSSIAFPTIVATAEAAEAVKQAVRVKSGVKKRYQTISIGIDPGKTIGLSAIGDRRIINEEILKTPEEVVNAVNEIKRMFKAREIILRVGSAGGTYRDRIIASLQEFHNLPIEIVGEESTTKPKSNSRKLGLHKDILAARKIANKKGHRIKKAIKVTTTPGEIKNIQRESRKKSRDITISKKLAEAVVKGEIDLEEAIKLQKRRGDEDLHPT